MATLLQWAGLRIISRVNTREGLGKRAGGHWFKEWLKLAWMLQEELNSNTTEEHKPQLQGESQDQSHPGRSCQQNGAGPSERQEATAPGATNLESCRRQQQDSGSGGGGGGDKDTGTRGPDSNPYFERIPPSWLPFYHRLWPKASSTPWVMLTCNLSTRYLDTWGKTFRVTGFTLKRRQAYWL